jgi:hypothetical protein
MRKIVNVLEEINDTLKDVLLILIYIIKQKEVLNGKGKNFYRIGKG